MPAITSKSIENRNSRSEDKTTVPPANTILLIDDDKNISDMVSLMLEHLGYSVILTSGGNEALAVLNTESRDIGCVLTDLSMPDMDGWEILSFVKKISPEMPVILASGYDEAHVRSSCQRQIPDAYIQKPFQMAELETTLGRVLEQA